LNPTLLQRIARGEREAVEACLDRYGPLVWSLARRFFRERAEAEDAVQDVFIDLWTKASRYDPSIAEESVFVAMIARRRLIDRLRRNRREPPSETLEAAGTIADLKPSAETDGDAARAAKLLETLRPEQREVLELSIYQGLSHSEVAGRLGMPLGTVKTHVRRGLMALRERLAPPSRHLGTA
jgi:RNA polymerase sigma-70 factor (ECF subfamily)